MRACAFQSSLAAVLDHCTSQHAWDLAATDQVRAGEMFDAELRDGFNVVLVCSSSARNLIAAAVGSFSEAAAVWPYDLCYLHTYSAHICRR